MTPCLHFATWNVHNAPPDEPRRGCDNCGRIRPAHRPVIRRVEVDGWVWCSTARQVEPAISSGEWVEYVPATISQIVHEAAARYDERASYRASIEARRELDDVEHCGQCGRALGNGFACGPECD